MNLAPVAKRADDPIEWACWNLDNPVPELQRKRMVVAAHDRARLSFDYCAAVRLRAELPLRFLLLSEAWTILGVPPILRPTPSEVPQGEDHRALEMIADLEWQARRYPKHKARWPKWQRLFAPGAEPYQVAFHISWRGKRKPHALATGLALKPEQQAECLRLRYGGLVDAHGTFRGEREAGEAIYNAQQRRDLSARMRNKPQGGQRSYDRRMLIWRCVQIAPDSPAQVARYYTALTGLRMSRPLAGKLMGEIEADLRQWRREQV